MCYITLPQHFPPSCMPVSVHAGSSAGFSRIWCHVVRVSVERAESTQRGGSFIKIVLTSLLDSFSTLTWRPTSWQRTPISPTNSSPRYVTLRTDKHVFHVFIKNHFRSSFTLFCSVFNNHERFLCQDPYSGCVSVLCSTCTSFSMPC